MGLREDFQIDEVEKVERLCPVLREIAGIPALRDRLSFYGGTSLNFIHFKDIPRLSVDLDFNYREPEGVDWGKDRDDVDRWFKLAFRKAGFAEKDLQIRSSWPMTTFHLHYTRARGGRGNLLVEVGYMRRSPFSPADEERIFTDPLTGDRFSVKTPPREELFANKWCTMLSRTSPRDLFDVYTISKLDVDLGLFLQHAVLDSLTRPDPLHRKDLRALIYSIPVDDRLRNLLRGRQVPPDLHEQALDFSQTVIDGLGDHHRSCLDAFYDRGELDLTWLDGRFHPRAHDHPGIRWMLKKRKG